MHGSEATWQRVKAKFPDDDPSSVSDVATSAVAASASDVEGESGPMWRPVEGFDRYVAIEVIHSRNALSGGGSDALRCSHLQSINR